MKFKAEIDVMPLDALLDPQGKAVTNSMKNIGLPEIENVRIGRHVQLSVEAANKSEAEAKVEQACNKRHKQKPPRKVKSCRLNHVSS